MAIELLLSNQKPTQQRFQLLRTRNSAHQFLPVSAIQSERLNRQSRSSSSLAGAIFGEFVSAKWYRKRTSQAPHTQHTPTYLFRYSSFLPDRSLQYQTNHAALLHFRKSFSL